MDRSAKGSWRKKGRSSTTRRKASTSEASSKWKERRVDATQTAAFRQRLRLMGLSLVALALIVAFVLALLWRGKTTPVLTLGVWQYDAALPPNSYAAEDLQLLNGLNPDDTNLSVTPDDYNGRMTAGQCLEYLQENLPKLKPGGPNKRAMVIYLTAHGVVNEANQPCLLFSDADALDSSTWLLLDDLLAVLGEHQAKPSSDQSQLLLILDAGRIETCLPMGLLYNAFADRLSESVLAAEIPGLHVLNANGPGERAWAAPEWEATPFGLFVTKGINGDAADGDNIVTLLELYRYVQRNVSSWGLTHRAIPQQPILIPEISEADDFALNYAGTNVKLLADPANRQSRRVELIAELDRIKLLWEKFDEVVRDRALYRNAPLELRELQSLLLRAEELLWAGQPYRRELTDALAAIEMRIGDIGTSSLPEGVRGLSIPLAKRFEPIPESEADIQNRLAAWKAASGRPVPKEGDPPLPPITYVAAADVGTRWLGGLPEVTSKQIQQVVDYVHSATPRSDRGPTRMSAAFSDGKLPDVVEVQFLKLLTGYIDWPSADDESPELLRTIRLAIAARGAAEKAAAPGDSRVHLWAHPLVDEADRDRRLAEDLLFVGGTAEVATSQTVLERLAGAPPAAKSYAAADQRAEQIASFYATRDAVWAELPYLAAWILQQNSQTAVEGTGESPMALTNQLVELVEANHRLSAELDRCLIERSADPSDVLQSEAKTVAQLHDETKGIYKQSCDYLQRQAGKDRPTLLRIHQALQVPLLNAGRRSALSDKYVEILYTQGDLQEDVEAAASQEDLSSVPVEMLQAGQTALAQYRQVLTELEPHPALAILNRRGLSPVTESSNRTWPERDSEQSGLSWLATQGGWIRERLRDLKSTADEYTQHGPAEATANPALIRKGVSRADRLCRAAAPMLSISPWSSSELDPTARLQRVDLQFAMLWQSWRAMEDFWGPSNAQPRNYFDLAASTYLNSASLLETAPRGFFHNDIELTKLLKERIEAADEIAVQTEDALTLQTDVSVPHQMDVVWSQRVPHGVGALFIAQPDVAGGEETLLPVSDTSGQRKLRRQTSRLSPDKSLHKLEYQLPVENLNAAGSGADLKGLCYYRGHVYEKSFRVLWPPWITRVEVTPTPPDAAQITVEGEGQRTGHVMFVFDCSGSMDAKKMTTAKNSIRAILESLKAGGKCEVGLRAYGRRAKFTDESDCSKKDYIDGVTPGSVYPDLDVERLFPLATLDDRHHAALLKQIADLQPFGQTPLYLSLKRAFTEDDFLRAKADDPKHLIVITDGLNFQTKCLKIEERPERATEMREVLQARTNSGRYRDVQIDIVGLALNASDAELSELKSLATNTGGEYFPAKDTGSLTDALRDALSLVEYSVSGDGVAQGTPMPLDLGKTCPLSKLPPVPTPHDVRIVGIDRAPSGLVQIEGGESLLLQYDASRNRLFYPRYEPIRFDRSDAKRGDAQVCNDPAGSGDYTVGALLPRRDAKDVEFYVYLQHEDELRFTSRPKHVWAEIRPVGADSDRVYYFSDPDFVPDRPVPVFRFTAEDWPKTADEADIKLWFKFDAASAQPQWEAEVGQRPSDVVELDDLPGVRFELDSKLLDQGAYSVVVTERHPFDQEVQPTRVRIEPPPDEAIRHEFAGVVNVVKHEFRYQKQIRSTVSITTKERIITGAIDVKRMRVKVER